MTTFAQSSIQADLRTYAHTRRETYASLIYVVSNQISAHIYDSLRKMRKILCGDLVSWEFKST